MNWQKTLAEWRRQWRWLSKFSNYNVGEEDIFERCAEEIEPFLRELQEKLDSCEVRIKEMRREHKLCEEDFEHAAFEQNAVIQYLESKLAAAEGKKP